MQKIYYAVSSLLILAIAMVAYPRGTENSLTEIAVLVPLQHPAMDAIVAGLREELGDELLIKVYNAQGDATLQAAILQQLKVRGTQIVLPIGTAATLMTLQQLPDRTVVHLAANFEESDRTAGQKVTGVLDELSPALSVDLARALIPGLQKITLIHSPADKVYPEVAAFEERAKQHGIAVQRLLVQAQSELYTMTQQVAPDSQLIVVLKDHMVVAGIATLTECASRLGIPLMASDEGSVTGGASFASGVSEASIGRAGGKLVRQIIRGTPAGDLPIVRVEEIRLFYRPKATTCLPIIQVAQAFGYAPTEVAP